MLGFFENQHNRKFVRNSDQCPKFVLKSSQNVLKIRPHGRQWWNHW